MQGPVALCPLAPPSFKRWQIQCRVSRHTARVPERILPHRRPEHRFFRLCEQPRRLERKCNKLRSGPRIRITTHHHLSVKVFNMRHSRRSSLPSDVALESLPPVILRKVSLVWCLPFSIPISFPSCDCDVAPGKLEHRHLVTPKSSSLEIAAMIKHDPQDDP